MKPDILFPTGLAAAFGGGHRQLRAAMKLHGASMRAQAPSAHRPKAVSPEERALAARRAEARKAQLAADRAQTLATLTSLKIGSETRN